jgi:predicted Na+-dependent transporter
MNDDFSTGLIGIACVILIPFALVVGIIVGAMSEAPRERDKTIIYCIDNPDQCKIEYTYLKLKETQNEN